MHLDVLALNIPAKAFKICKRTGGGHGAKIEPIIGQTWLSCIAHRFAADISWCILVLARAEEYRLGPGHYSVECGCILSKRRR